MIHTKYVLPTWAAPNSMLPTLVCVTYLFVSYLNVNYFECVCEIQCPLLGSCLVQHSRGCLSLVFHIPLEYDTSTVSGNLVHKFCNRDLHALFVEPFSCKCPISVPTVHGEDWEVITSGHGLLIVTWKLHFVCEAVTSQVCRWSSRGT